VRINFSVAYVHSVGIIKIITRFLYDFESICSSTYLLSYFVMFPASLIIGYYIQWKSRLSDHRLSDIPLYRRSVSDRSILQQSTQHVVE
jgi:hypothetical protein